MQQFSSSNANSHTLDSNTLSSSPNLSIHGEKPSGPKSLAMKARQLRFDGFRVSQDHRSRLPSCVSRFLGYRPPGAEPPYEPLPFPPFTWLNQIPLQYEVWLFGWIGAFGGILLIEAIMSTSTAFRDIYRVPTIITSFGASAVLLFGVVESPLAQPRNFVLGQFISALIGTAITRLFVLNSSYQGYLDNATFQPSTFINGAVSMATSLLGQFMLGAVHPPAGATGLNAAVESNIVSLSWRYLPTVLASSLLMLGWALIINNLGRRRYPMYWWEPESRWVAPVSKEEEVREESDLRRIEQGDAPGPETSGVREDVLFQRLENEEGN